MNYFLLGIDLEDTTYESKYNSPHLQFQIIVNKYLSFLEEYKFKTTFFVVGRTAQIYPALVRKIYEKGHEIACHSNQHIPLNLLNESEFNKDLIENVLILKNLGISEICGFRAPLFSVTKKTSWIYNILIQNGFTYSSSILPSTNPLYGWNNFSKKIVLINNKLVELPISLNLLNLPVGGVYLRALPYLINNSLIKKTFNCNDPLISYIHPYDIDTSPTSNKFKYIRNNLFYNWIMKYNRSKTISIVRKILIDNCATIVPYREYIKTIQSSSILNKFQT